MMQRISLPAKIIKLYYPQFILLFGCITGYVDWRLVILAYIGYCTYIQTSTKTQLFYNESSSINKKILQYCSVIQNAHFRPYFFLPTSFLQIMFVPFLNLPKTKLDFEKNKEKVNEYGSTLSWVEVEGNKKEDDNLPIIDEKSPVLIILPGLTGDGSDGYINHISYHGVKNGFKVVVYNNRMLSREIVLDPDIRLDLVEEFESAVSLIEKKYPKRKIFAIGFSYGSNKLTKFLGTLNTGKDGKPRISGAVSVCNPYNLLICQRFLHDSIFDNVILYFLKNKLRKHYNEVKKFEKGLDLELDKALNSKCVYDYDEHIIRRVLRYRSPDHYYNEMSCVHHMHKISVPLLCISTIDDSITTSKAVPYEEVEQNPNLMLLTTDTGGHLCWIGNKSLTSLEPWVNEPIMDYLMALRKLGV